MSALEGLVQIINGSGYAFASVDGLASVQSAAEDLKKNPNDPGLQAAYNAAYWNAVAAETALVPGVGAVYASKAFAADLENISVNKINPTSEEGASAYVSLMGNFAVMLSQGVAVGALVADSPLTVVAAGSTLAASELVDFASAILTATGVYLDKSTIGNYLANGARAVGISPNADGSYNVSDTGNSSLNINFDGSTPQSTFTMNSVDIRSGNTLYVPTVDANGNVTGFTAQVPTDVYQYSDGTAGANFGDGASVETRVTDMPDSPSGASATAKWTIFNGIGGSRNANIVQYSDGTFGILNGSPGNYTVDMKNVGAPLPGQSNDVSMTDDSGQISAVISGNGATLDVSNSAVDLTDGASATITGSNNTITAGNGDTVAGGSNTTLLVDGSNNVVNSPLAGSSLTLEGTGNQFNGGGSQLSIGAGAQATVNGSGNDIAALSGSAFTINGSDEQVNASGATMTLGTNSNANIVGNNDTTYLMGGSYNVSGTGNTIDATGGTSFNLSGGNDSVNLGGTGDYVGLLGGSYSVSGTGDTIDTWGGTTLNLSGGGDTVGLGGSGDYLGLLGGTYSVSGTGDTIDTWGGTTLNLSGSGDTVGLGGSGDYLGLLGGTYSVTGTGDTIDTWGGTTLNLSGGGDTVGLGGSGDYLGLLRGTYSVTGTGDTIDTWGGTTLNLSGGGDTVGLGGSGDYLGLLGGTYSVSGTGDTIDTWGGTSFNLSGGGDTVSLGGTGDYLGLLGGTYSVTGTGDTIDTWGGTSFNLSGGGDTVGLGGSGDYLGLLGGTYSVTGTGDTIDTWGGTSFNLSGGGDTVGLGGSGDYLGLLGGTYSVSGTDDTIDTWSGTSLNLSGGHDTIGLGGSGDYLGLLGGTGYKVEGSGDTVDSWANTGLEVVGSGDSINVGADSTVISDGNGDVLNGVSVSDGNTYDTNNGDSLSGGTDYGDGFYGYYGFAGKQSTINAVLGSNIGSIAQYDLSIGNQVGAAAADAGLHQAQEMAATTPTAGIGTAVDVGAGDKWSGDAITWSVAAGMDSQYDTEIDQAFATWGVASGLKFKEVPGSASADIRIGFGDLNTSTSGVAGYTTFKAEDGQISTATIELEDPDQVALVTGAGGTQTYAGTDATFEQLLLHEIGHALGLADDSDQNSIMYYELTSNNRMLDDTDVAGIQSLYGLGKSPTGAVATMDDEAIVTDQIGQLVARMAAFSSQAAGDTTVISDDYDHYHFALAATPT